MTIYGELFNSVVAARKLLLELDGQKEFAAPGLQPKPVLQTLGAGKNFLIAFEVLFLSFPVVLTTSFMSADSRRILCFQHNPYFTNYNSIWIESLSYSILVFDKFSQWEEKRY